MGALGSCRDPWSLGASLCAPASAVHPDVMAQLVRGGQQVPHSIPGGQASDAGPRSCVGQTHSLAVGSILRRVLTLHAADVDGHAPESRDETHYVLCADTRVALWRP